VEIARRLEELDAPPEIAAWASARESFDEAWDACPTARHRLWLAGVAGMPVEAIVEAGCAAFFAHAEHAPELDEFVEAVEESVGATDAASCAALAERCEDAAGAGGPYREEIRRRAIARVASHLCRAFEALRSAEASMESARMMRAQTAAAYMAGGVQAFLPAEPAPITLLDAALSTAERGLVVLAVASAAEAVGELATIAGASATWIDEAAWDALVPDGEEP
jgi:hypothetical protein